MHVCIYDAIFFGDILLLGGAAAGANKGTMGLGCTAYYAGPFDF